MELFHVVAAYARGKDWKKFGISFGVKFCYALILVAISCCCYGLWYAMNPDFNELLSELASGVGFLPIELLLLTLMIDGVAQWRQKKAMKKKMVTTIGIFFHEIGNDVVVGLLPYLKDRGCVTFDGVASWTDADFRYHGRTFSKAIPAFELVGKNILGFREILRGKRDELLMLLTSSSVMEYDRLLRLLWGILHILDELEMRAASGVDLSNCPLHDGSHLQDDFGEVFSSLVLEWINYLHHLKNNFPMLFVIAAKSVAFKAAPPKPDDDGVFIGRSPSEPPPDYAHELDSHSSKSSFNAGEVAIDLESP